MHGPTVENYYSTGEDIGIYRTPEQSKFLIPGGYFRMFIVSIVKQVTESIVSISTCILVIKLTDNLNPMINCGLQFKNVL